MDETSARCAPVPAGAAVPIGRYERPSTLVSVVTSTIIMFSAAPSAADTDPDLADIEAALAADAPELPAAAGSPAQAAAGTPTNPNLAVIADIALAAFSEDEHGQTGAHDPKDNGFNFQQLELAMGAAADPYFRFDASLVFGEFGVELEEAYGTTLSLPWGLQSRFGQFLNRFGRQNSQHPHAWAFADQPFALGRVFGSEGSRGLGVELSWLTPLPWYVELVTATTMADGSATNRSFWGSDNPGVKDPGDVVYLTALKQFFPLDSDWSLAWGLSAMFGPNSTGRDNRSEIFGSDLYLKYRPISSGAGADDTLLSLQSEWIYRRRQVPGDVLQDLSSYTQMTWRWTQRWEVSGRVEYGSPTLDQSGDVAFTDPLDPEWTTTRARLSSALSFSPTEFSRLRAQGSRDALPNASGRDAVWAAFLAVELVVGAHGAHQF